MTVIETSVDSVVLDLGETERSWPTQGRRGGHHPAGPGHPRPDRSSSARLREGGLPATGPADEIGKEQPGLSSAASAWHAFLLRKASQRIIGMIEAALRPRGWTVHHFGVLCSVEAEPGQSQRIVGERLRIDRTTIVSLADDLQNAGLLERHRGVDRRTFCLHLTEAGHTHLAQLKTIVNDMHAEFLAPLSATEQTTLHDLLLKLATSRS